MEPRPQRPRQQPQASQTAPVQDSGRPTSPPTDQPQQQAYPQGFDPAGFIAPPRAEYDYSPLDLAPPGQRRRRQIIAGIIGALAVLAIGALVVAGWMMLRDDNADPNVSDSGDNRVAQLTETPTATTAATTNDDASTPPTEEQAAAPTATTGPTAAPTSESRVYTADNISTALPVAEQMPPGFDGGADTPLPLADVVTALGGSPEIETQLNDLGWQAAISRSFQSTDPATTGTTLINVSVHSFRDDAAAQAAMPVYTDALIGFGWTEAEGQQYADGSRTLTWTNPDTGNVSVSIYMVSGQFLYRIYAEAPSGVDPTPAAIHVAEQLAA